MKLELQCVSLEQAKRLKELGVEQLGIFSWILSMNGKWSLSHLDLGVQHAEWLQNRGKIKESTTSGISALAHEVGQMIVSEAISKLPAGEFNTYYSAWTVAELGVMFGRGTKATEKLYDAVMQRLNSGNSFHIAYSPQFLANCLIGAIEQGWTTAEEINSRLNETTQR